MPVLVALTCLEIYHLVSGAVPRRGDLAHAHAATIIALEHKLGLFVEPQLQHLALHHAPLPVFGAILDDSVLQQASALIYGGAHLPWLAAMLLWLALFRREHLARLCGLAALSTMLAVLLAALYPVAPPRFVLAGAPYAMQDVTGVPLSEHALVRLVGFNPYASLPSVHVLWALLTGLGLFLGANSRATRTLAVVFPLVSAGTVLITANHYVLDCLASVLLLAACLLLERGWLVLRSSISRRYPLGAPGDPAPWRSWVQVPAAPFLLCAITGMLLLVSLDPWQRLFGLLLACGPLGLLAIHRPSYPAVTDVPASHRAAEWWCGLLLIAGASFIGSVDPYPRLAGSLLWLFAASMLLYVTMRSAEQTAWSRLFTTGCNPSEVAAQEGI